MLIKGFKSSSKSLNNILDFFERLNMAKEILQDKVDSIQPNIKYNQFVDRHKSASSVSKKTRVKPGHKTLRRVSE